MIAEKNGITVDTRTAAPARKMIKCPQKTGINLNLQEDRQRDRRTLLIGILAIAALVTVVVNFGVLQQYRRLDKAQAAYDRVHTQYVSAQEALSDYDRVLLEYRTYSMDWMTAAGSEDIPAAVDRQTALDLLEQEMLSHGSLTALQITQNTMNLRHVRPPAPLPHRGQRLPQRRLHGGGQGRHHHGFHRPHRTAPAGGGVSMNRELTKREKTLLLVLVVLVLVLGYCKLFLEPIDRQITSLRTNTDIEQAELDTDRVRLAQLEQMQQAIAAIKASGQERALPQYDNDQALMTELDKLMAATLQYEVDCTEGTTQEGYLVLRPVTLTYQTASYAQSRQIIDALSASANVNFLSNVDVQYDADKAQYKTVLHLIFFELMP